MRRSSRLIATLGAVLVTVPLFAQVTPAAGYTPPDDTPSFKVGVTIFGDYTWIDSPTTKDSDGNTIHPSSFNVSRAYINGTGSSLAGSQDFRLKYAYAQFNLDDWMTRGSWVRFGVQQTPLVDYEEGIY